MWYAVLVTVVAMFALTEYYNRRIMAAMKATEKRRPVNGRTSHAPRTESMR